MAFKIHRAVFILVALFTTFISFWLYLKLFLRFSDGEISQTGGAGSSAAEDIPLHSSKDLTLRFNEDGTFRIVIFEDLHYGEGAYIVYVERLSQI